MREKRKEIIDEISRNERVPDPAAHVSERGRERRRRGEATSKDWVGGHELFRRPFGQVARPSYPPLSFAPDATPSICLCPLLILSISFSLYTF
jgi:hypothetical protein